MTANITDTGIRGYLKWLKQDQPVLYQLVAPQVVEQAPQAFSDFEQSRAMGALMDVTTGGWHSGPDWSDRGASEYRYNNPAAIASAYGSVQTGLGADTSGAYDGGYRFGRLADDASSTDVANVANTGQSTADITSIIGNIVAGASAIYQDQAQRDIVIATNQAQLQRAQAGYPPNQTSTNSLGVPVATFVQRNPGLTGSGLLLGVGLVIGWVLLKKRSAR